LVVKMVGWDISMSPFVGNVVTVVSVRG